MSRSGDGWGLWRKLREAGNVPVKAMLATPDQIVRLPQSHQKLHESQSCKIYMHVYAIFWFICSYASYMQKPHMQKYVKRCTTYAYICKIWTYLHINVLFKKYVKYGQIAYRARDHIAAVWCCLKYAVLHIFHKYEKNVIMCKIWDRSSYECS